MDVSTVHALPDHLAIAGEYEAFLDVLEKSKISLLVLGFNLCNTSEESGNFLEPFFLGFLCKGSIHVCPLVILTFGSSFQVLGCCANLSILLEELEPHLGMLFLVVGCLFEDGGNLLVAFLSCL